MSASPLLLRAGPLRTTLQDGRLGAIHWRGPQGTFKAWHGLHWLLRDPHWRTPGLQLRPPALTEVAGGWRVCLEGAFGPDPAGPGETPAPAVDALNTTLVVEGLEDGVLTVTGEAAVALGATPRAVNRIGLCLLHSLASASARVEVVHDDGRLSRSVLPSLVSPWPPFTGIRGLRIALAPGCWAVADFEGENFEIEDQRNNADASFKTYARSNFLPRPFLLEPGALVRQSVRLTVERRGRGVAVGQSVSGALPSPMYAPHDAPAGSVPGQTPPSVAPPSTFGGPDVGDGARSAVSVLQLTRMHVDTPRALALGLEIEAADLGQPLEVAQSQAHALRPDRLHLAWDPLTPLPARQASVLAAMLQGAVAALRLDLHRLDDPARRAALPALAACLHAAGIPPAAIAAVAAFPTSAAAVAAVRAAFPASAIGGGSADFFVQLNRMDRLPPLDFLTFTVCPTVHQADDRTVLDSAQALPGMLATLAQRYPGLPVHVGPSRIAARHSPLGAPAVSADGSPMPLAGHDARDADGLGVVWAASHVAGLAAQAMPSGVGAAAATVLRWADCGPCAAGEAFWAAMPARPPGRLIQPLQTGHPEVTGWRWVVEGETGHRHEDWLVHTGDAACTVVGLQAVTTQSRFQQSQSQQAQGPRAQRPQGPTLQTLVQAPPGAATRGVVGQPADAGWVLPPRSVSHVRWP